VKNNESENILDARSFLEDSTLLSVISVNGSISGITVLGSELFVLIYETRQVNVYNTNNFTLTHSITITASPTPNLTAIVASPRYNCLYISDAGQ